jgi:hypothetical protein
MERKQMKEFMTVGYIASHQMLLRCPFDADVAAPHIDVPKPRPEMLRRLHQRLQLQIPRLKRRELRHPLCGQVIEGIRAIGQQIPGAKCCNDAVRLTTANMSDGSE